MVGSVGESLRSMEPGSAPAPYQTCRSRAGRPASAGSGPSPAGPMVPNAERAAPVSPPRRGGATDSDVGKSTTGRFSRRRSHSPLLTSYIRHLPRHLTSHRQQHQQRREPRSSHTHLYIIPWWHRNHHSIKHGDPSQGPPRPSPWRLVSGRHALRSRDRHPRHCLAKEILCFARPLWASGSPGARHQRRDVSAHARGAQGAACCGQGGLVRPSFCLSTGCRGLDLDSP